MIKSNLTSDKNLIPPVNRSGLNSANKHLYLHRIHYAKLFEAAKIHVRIMRFTCCLNMGFNLTKLKLGPDLFCMTIYTVKRFGLDCHFANAFVRKNILSVYDVVAI